jgi:chorismate synthase
MTPPPGAPMPQAQPSAPAAAPAMPGPAPQPPKQMGPPPVTIDAVVALLRDDKMRGFRIDVEVDSMISADQNAEKQQRTEFVTAVGGYFEKFAPLIEKMPQMAPLVGGMLQWAVRGFKVGAELEDLIEKTMSNVSDALSQPRPPQADPTEMVKLEATKTKAAAEASRANTDAQVAQTEGAAKIATAKINVVGKVLEHHHAMADRASEVAAAAVVPEQPAMPAPTIPGQQ